MTKNKLDSQTSEQEGSSSKRVKTEPSETQQQVTINRLEKKIIKLKQKQIEKNQILLFLQNILDTDLSNKVLVDINPSTNELVVLGRPPVLGSPRKQMRHVTPFSFIKLLLINQLQDTDSLETLFELFSQNIKRFSLPDQGICLTKDEYNSLELEEEAFKYKINTFKSGEQRTYYLIKQNKFQEEWFAKLGFDETQKNNSKLHYISKKAKFIDNAFEYLKAAINDQNTFNIACEALARLILILFNSRTNIAFPEEGNSIIYEIRFYESVEDAKAGNKKYKALSHKEIVEKIKKNEDLKDKIRIVDNEGARIENAKNALSLINRCIEEYKFNPTKTLERARYIQNYQKHDVKLVLPGSIKEDLKLHETYDAELKEENLLSLAKYHVAKHLYTVFDFKPLETEVFVPALPSDKTQFHIKVFTSAKGMRQVEYTIRKGFEYRADQKRSFVGYNAEVKFRQEQAETQDKKAKTQEFLAKKAIEHLNITLSSFTSIIKNSQQNERIPFEIFKSFMQLIEIDYDIKYDDLEQTIKLEEFWPEVQEVGALSSESEFDEGTSR